jgi:NodT family efflux transporter outer membrane factor (OMF) lipoprotein
MSAVVSAVLPGCGMMSTLLPSPAAPAAAPAAWVAPLPGEAALAHDGKLASLADWWQQQQDPLLVELIAAAQDINGNISSARARIAQANAERIATSAALQPTVDASLSAQRRSAFPPFPGGNVYQGTLQASWEIDLFGTNRMARDAAQQRLAGAEAGWHEARVSVAAEVANQYYAWRSCSRLLTITEADATSRAETARLTELAAGAGFQSPANAALARASAAEGRSRVSQQRAQCDIDIKLLVMLTGLPETNLRARLDVPPTLADALPTPVALPSLPAQTLAQRPDVYAAAQQVAAASNEVGATDAQRYPRLALAGNIGRNRFESGGSAINLNSWTIGPVALTLPVFDGGRRRANVDAAMARYDEATSNYRAVVRRAVREVEEALVNLDSSAARSDDARLAIEGFSASLSAVQQRYDNGMASLFELEEARRSKLAAQTALVALQRERIAAWVALYRAAGGGWQAPTAAARDNANH